MTEAAFDPAGAEDDTPWRDRAACRGQDPDLWFPNKGQTAKTGRSICASCPAVVQCLEHAVATQPEGMWGATSKRQRRRLRIIWFQRAHAHRSDCDDPGCRWCRTVDAHLASLEVRQGPQQLNGPGARCGFKSSYARGCRCGPCKLAISPAGSRLRLAGVEIAAWWSQWFGDNTDDRLIWHAKRLAEFEQPEAVAS